MATRAQNELHRYKKGTEITTVLDGVETVLIVIRDYGTELFGASKKDDPTDVGFYDLHGCIFTANTELL